MSKLDKITIIRVATEASQEIGALRQRNKVLSAQLDVVHIFARALGMHQSPMGMGEDVKWKLDMIVEDLKNEKIREDVEASTNEPK